MFNVVTRKTAKLRMALTGVSGSGKTLGALKIAYGMTHDWSKIALIDTEHERGRFYAERSDLGTGAFLYAALEPPYSPERYKSLVAEGAQAVGPDGVVIVDSLSHAWNNVGGVLEIKDQIVEQSGGRKNSYTAWNDAGRIQNDFINYILSVDCHTIVTMRSKMDYAMEEDDRGKQHPVKIGLAPIQRDDTEYEFDVVLNINRDHIATASKDTTFLDQYGAMITPALGEQLALWLREGKEPDLCERCGHVINAYGSKSADEMVAGTLGITGHKMCGLCFVEYQKARKNVIQKILTAKGITPDAYAAKMQEWVDQGVFDTTDVMKLDDDKLESLYVLLQQ